MCTHYNLYIHPHFSNVFHSLDSLNGACTADAPVSYFLCISDNSVHVITVISVFSEQYWQVFSIHLFGIGCKIFLGHSFLFMLLKCVAHFSNRYFLLLIFSLTQLNIEILCIILFIFIKVWSTAQNFTFWDKCSLEVEKNYISIKRYYIKIITIKLIEINLETNLFLLN